MTSLNKTHAVQLNITILRNLNFKNKSKEIRKIYKISIQEKHVQLNLKI